MTATAVPLAEATRGGATESVHPGSAVIADAQGIRWSAGDPAQRIFTRSATKPIQALPLVESGAADRFAISGAELALACASHNGEPVHAACAAAWLDRIGLNEANLECGIHWPMRQEAGRALAAGGAVPSQLHNNCSGKHAGFLATALHLGEPLEGYVAADHPVQRRWLALVEELSGASIADGPVGLDGCRIPSPTLPLAALAGAYARFADPAGLGAVRTAAIDRIARAIAANPHMIAGEGRACTRIAAITEGRVIAKIGAEGVYAGWIPEAGIGFALKIADGAMRAAEVAVVGLIRAALGPGHELSDRLAPLARVPLRTCGGEHAGEIRATFPAGAR